MFLNSLIAWVHKLFYVSLAFVRSFHRALISPRVHTHLSNSNSDTHTAQKGLWFSGGLNEPDQKHGGA